MRASDLIKNKTYYSPQLDGSYRDLVFIERSENRGKYRPSVSYFDCALGTVSFSDYELRKILESKADFTQ